MIDENKYQNISFIHNINTISLHDYKTSFPIHWHKCVELVAFPMKSKYKQLPRISINGLEYELAPGDIIFIWPGELHGTIQNTEHLIASIQFPSTLYNDLVEFAPYLHLFRTIHHVHHLETPVFAQNLMDDFKQILKLQEKAKPLSGVEAIIHVYHMLLTLGQHINDQLLTANESSSKSFDKSMDKISLACNFIRENCEQNLTLKQVSDYMGFSVSYFSRMFKQTTNYNFIEYLTIQRMKRAQFLLADHTLSITEIAFQAGFKSISSFNRIFKDYMNCSPREYRKYYFLDA